MVTRSVLAGPALDVTLMTALLLTYIWLWQGSFPGDYLVCGTLYFGIGVWGHWRWKESAAEIGVRADNAGPALVFGLKFVGPIVVVTPALGAWLGTIEAVKLPDLSDVPRGLGWGLFWATLQQYGLACVFYRRLRDLLGSHWGASLGAAGLFALFHVPNPFLIPVTFAGAIIACQVYRRAPNVFVLGLLHLLLSIALRGSFGAGITHHMKVGPGYWSG